MSINTKLKRASVQVYTRGLVRPPATGAITAGDRAASAWLYAGFTYPAPSPNDVRLYDNGFGFTFRLSL